MEKLGLRVRVRSVQPLRGFTVLISFENDAQREINLEPYFHGPIFEPIRNNPSMFSSMKIEGGTIAWDSGADAEAILAAVHRPGRNVYLIF